QCARGPARVLARAEGTFSGPAVLGIRAASLVFALPWLPTFPQDFPVVFDLTPDWGSSPTLTLLLATLWQQRWRDFSLEVRPNCRVEILPDATPLLRARRHHRPDPLAPTPPFLPARPLCYLPVYHHEPDCLLCRVVRRLYPGRRHEREVTRPVARQTLGHRLR